MNKPITALIILDGFGYTDNPKGNAIYKANTKNIDELWEKYPSTFLDASGLAVGLPRGQMGNSEVGHLNLGAGRIVYQELSRITKSIEDGDFFTNPALMKAMENARNHNTDLHLMGLLSDGGVHSHSSHLYALLEMAKKQNIKNVYIHCFLDGRDTPPQSARGYIGELENQIKEIGIGKIASISGRYYAMDRDNRWERIRLAYDAMVVGKGETASTAGQAIEASYDKNITDEFIMPTVIKNSDQAVGAIKEDDSIIFFNFRPDRARQLTRALVEGDVKTTFITMTQYDKTIDGVDIAYLPQSIENTLGEYLSKSNKTQLRIAETEKYAHVTYFFNGGIEKEFTGEDRILIPSPKVATYDLQPEMSALEVTNKVLEAVESQKYDFMVLNYANADMVGHTGNFDAAVKAIEAVDDCTGRVVEKILENNGQIIITADHGNAEKMMDYQTEKAHTAHTENLVKCMVIGAGNVSLKKGKLSDIAPTLLELMDLEKPLEMTGESLIKNK